MMRYIFIVGSRARAVQAESVERLLNSRFPEPENAILTDPSDSRIDRLCRAYCLEELRLVAVGGDGTVHRLLAAAFRYDIPIGILPCGTANDLARAIGLKRSLRKCCDVIRADHTRAIDLISVNGSLFATCGGLGLPSSAAILHSRSRKANTCLSVKGYLKSSYLLAALCAMGRRQSLEVRIRDNHRGWSGCVMAVVVSNQARFGALFSVSPEAVHDDGIIDLCIIPDPAGRYRKLRILLQAALRRKRLGPGVIHSRIQQAHILTERPVPFLGDGEILSRGNDFRIEVLHKAVRLIVPGKWSAEELQGRHLLTKAVHRDSRESNEEPCRRSLSGRQGIIENNTASNPGPNVPAWNSQVCPCRGNAGPQF